MNTNNIYIIARKEFISNLKNYWFFLSAIIFCLLNFIIIYFGEILSGDHSETDIRALSLSIIHLQMYLIPLFSFILSYDSILSDKESGVFYLILSYRVTLFDIFVGKLLGNSFVFTLSFLFGFLPVFFYLYILGIKFLILVKFFIISIWLSFIFNYLALYVSNFSRDRTFVILLSIFLWLFFVFIYDILFTFILVFFYGSISNNFLNLLLLFNPVELFRLISIFYFIPNDMTDLLGISVYFLNNLYIFIIILFWIILVFVNCIFSYFKYK